VSSVVPVHVERTFVITVAVFIAAGKYALGLDWHGAVLLGMILFSGHIRMAPMPLSQ